MNQPAADSTAALAALQPATSLPWLAALQRDALGRAQQLGLPARRSEAWKYLPVRALQGRQLDLAQDAAVDSQHSPCAGLATVLLAGGQVQLPAQAPDGVTLQAFSTLAPDHSLPVLPGALVPGDQMFAALNLACCQDGLLVQVPAGTRVSAPLGLISAGAGHRRIVLLLGEQAELTLVEDCQAGSSDALATQVLEAHLAAGASLQHTRLHREGSEGTTVDGLHVHLGRDARWQLDQVSLGAALRRNDIHCTLAGAGSQATVRGCFLLDGREQLDNHLVLEHQGAHASSDTVLRGLADGRSRGIVNGRIHIHRGAPGTRADLATNNLLLSGDAEIDAKPELEIYTDDVRCSHGATVGQLDEEALFYLRSRGVPGPEARQLLAFGFLNSVLADHPHAAIAEQLRAVLAAVWTGGVTP